MNLLNLHNSNIIAIVLVLLFLLAVLIFSYLYFKKKKNSDDIDGLISEDHTHENAYKLFPEAIVLLNEQNQVIYLNIEAEKMLGYKLRSIMGKPYREVFRLLNKDTKKLMVGFLDNSSSYENIKRECLLATHVKQTYSIELNLIHSQTPEGKRKVLVLRDITEIKALETQLSNIELYDPLTRMLKRKSFDAEVKQLIDNASKHNAKHILAFFSIDKFRVINDTIGYASSDNLIIILSEKIKDHITKSIDVVGRVSANEFAVVFRESTLAEAMESIHNILKSVSEFEFMSRRKQYSVTMSAGFMVIDVNTTSSTRAISEANIACNLAVTRGGNRVFAFSSENAEIKKLEGNLEWVMILKKAIRENRFQIHAQAIHPLKASEYKKSFHHYELLIRLSDEQGNPIFPAEFIAAAEYYSLMPSLDRWVIKNALEQISVLPDQNPTPVFAINLSGQSLNDPQFLNFVRKEITVSRVNPEMLCFEITEQVAVEDLNSINNFISNLKALGCSFSLDDFGTGVSSFAYLKSLNVDYLKIDGSFVKHIVNDDVARMMVQSINQVGHTMNLKIIAEYVENDKIIKILRQMGVDYGQGYEITMPVPFEEVIHHHTAVGNALLKTGVN